MPAAALARHRRCPRCRGEFPPEAIFCPNDGTRLEPEGEPPPPSTDTRLGTVIGSDITLQAIAGSGAMGRVYRGYQKSVERDVAVKILHRELSSNVQLVQRFHREAKIASKLRHPHVVEVFFTGELPDGALYMVMEYLDGASLASVLTPGSALPLPRALSILLQTSDAVGEAHALGIVHRDLKPENIMLVRRAERSDWVKVLDFGIAKLSVGDQSMETAAGLIFGTARYLSPEAAQGTPVGPAGDVYSLATILYQALAGSTPFEAEAPVGLLVKHIHETPPDLRSKPLAQGVPEPIARVVMDNLAKDPAKRAPNGRAFAAALVRAAKQSGVAIAEAHVLSRWNDPDVDDAAHPLAPTLDEASSMRLPRGAGAENAGLGSSPGSPPAPSPSHAPSHAPRTSEIAAPPRENRRGSLVTVLLALLLGGAIAMLLVEYVARRKDREHDAYVGRARRALIEGRYLDPPGDNVKELVTEGLAKWPDDAELERIRSDAAHEMVTRSMAARSTGDIGGARDLVVEASLLDGTDHSARMLVSQYQDELESIDAGVVSGAPRVFLDVAKIARPSEPIPVVVRIVPGSSTGKTITDATISIFDNGRTSNGRPVALSSTDSLVFRATIVAPKSGSYDVVFEAKVGGRPVRAERDLNVVELHP